MDADAGRRVNMLAGGGEFSSVVTEDDEGCIEVKKKKLETWEGQENRETISRQH